MNSVATNKLVILAGGISSRMKQSQQMNVNIDAQLIQQANERTKGMITIDAKDRPFLDYQLYNARQAGMNDVVIVIGEHDQSLRNYYGSNDRDNRYHGLQISYALQKIPTGRTKPLGTADALHQALLSRQDWQRHHFIVSNSDNLYSTTAITLLLQLESIGGWIDYDDDGLQFDETRISQFGLTRKDRDGYLTEIIEKPSIEEINRLRKRDGSLYVSMNIWRFHYDTILPYLDHCPLHPIRNEKELPAAVQNMIKDHPRSMKGIPLKEHVPDLTYKDDIVRVREYLQENFGELKW